MSVTSISEAPPVRRSTVSPWIAFGAVVVICWVLLIGHHHAGHAAAPVNDPATAFGMWALMAVAMMAPTAAPVLASLRELLGSTSMRPWWAFLGAYLTMWIGFAVVATALQVWLIDLDVVGHDGSSASWVFSAALLAGAGIYQSTSWKRRCLTQCVHPMTFFLRFWRDGVTGGARMGLRHGATCVGCCWALMLLAFVGGVANVWFMVLAAVVMAIEKLPVASRVVTTALGAVLLSAGAIALVVGVSVDHPPAHHHSMTIASAN